MRYIPKFANCGKNPPVAQCLLHSCHTTRLAPLFSQKTLRGEPGTRDIRTNWKNCTRSGSETTYSSESILPQPRCSAAGSVNDCLYVTHVAASKYTQQCRPVYCSPSPRCTPCTRRTGQRPHHAGRRPRHAGRRPRPRPSAAARRSRPRHSFCQNERPPRRRRTRSRPAPTSSSRRPA